MLKLVVILWCLLALSEATKFVTLVKIPSLKNKTAETELLQIKYKNLIKTTPENDSKKLDFLYKYVTYYLQLDIDQTNQAFRIMSSSGSFRSTYATGLFDTKQFSFDFENSKLVLGDIASKFYNDEITYAPFTSQVYWQFEMGADINGSKVCDKCKTILDTGTSLTVVPDAQYSKVMNAIGATLDKKCNTYSVDCYTIESLPTLKLNIGNTTFTIEAKDYVTQTGDICSTSFVNIGTDVWILGDIFTRKYQTVFDLAKEKFGFVPRSYN